MVNRLSLFPLPPATPVNHSEHPGKIDTERDRGTEACQGEELALAIITVLGSWCWPWTCDPRHSPGKGATVEGHEGPWEPERGCPQSGVWLMRASRKRRLNQEGQSMGPTGPRATQGAGRPGPQQAQVGCGGEPGGRATNKTQMTTARE
jgi:hypothetical protein